MKTQYACISGTDVSITSQNQDPVGGDISPNGQEILLKTYDYILYWKRESEENLSNTFKRSGIRLPYTREMQGEAICWSVSGNSFYTLSEGKNRTLWLHERL